MKSPKGFGKKYFTFASVLAHSTTKGVSARLAAATPFLQLRFDHDTNKQEEGDPPFCEVLTTETIFAKKTCHCNPIYRSQAKLILKNYIFIPRCPYYTTYFAFRRTGVHPPHFSS